MRFLRRLLLLALAVLAVTAVAVGWSLRSGDPSARVAGEAGAQSCAASGYKLVSRLDGSKSTIYNCVFAHRERCVTETGGVATDATVEVRLAFTTVLGGGRPGCLTASG